MPGALLESPHAIVITSEYGNMRIGGVGTYTNMLVDYLRRGFARLHVVEIPNASREPVSVREGPLGERILRAPYPRFQTRLDTDYDPKLEALYQLLPMDEPLLIFGNDSYGTYVGERIRAAARSRACLVHVPHLFASLSHFNGYGGERFGELLRTAPPRILPFIQKDVEMLSRADFVLFVSQYMLAYASQYLGGMPERHGIVGHYVETPPVVKEHYADEVRNVIFMGRLEVLKGLHELFEHLEDVMQCLPKAVFHIYGMGSLRDVLKWRGRRFGERLVWHGYRPREEVLRVLPEMDLAVIPSLCESFGYSALEAMAAGVPIIASDVGGLGELTSWLPEGLRLRSAVGGNPLFEDVKEIGLTLPREELLRVFSYAAAHPEILAATGRRGAALARELHGAGSYTQRMDEFIDRTLQWLANGVPSKATTDG